MKKFLVLACSLGVVDAEGERLTLEPKTVIDLPDKKYGLDEVAVKRMVKAGQATLGPVEEVEASDDKNAKTSDVAATISVDRMVELTGAIGLLEDGNKEHWTNNFVPEVSALKDITDNKVSAAERDDAWRVFQSSQPAVTNNRLVALVATVLGVDRDNAENFEESGAPTVAAMAEVLDGEVSEAERDLVWSLLSAV